MAFVMSTESLRKHCRKLNLYSSRLDLNDILHLQCKGITKIQGLEEFTGLTTLYLESNAISDIEGLEPVLKLSSLYLAKNFLSSTVGLGMLANLQVLDLADNNLSKLESLEALTQLRTLNVSGNKLNDLDALSELSKLPELMSLDLSNNRIGREREGVTKADQAEEDDAVVDFLCGLRLKWLRLVGNPFVRRVVGYRKKFVGRMQTLNYFDDQPAFKKDRRLALAYLSGGVEAEREERAKINEEERNRREERSREFDRMVAEARERAKTNPIVHDPSIFRAKEPEPQPPPLLEEQDEQEEEEEVVPTVTEVVEAAAPAEEEEEEEGASTSDQDVESHPIGSSSSSSCDEEEASPYPPNYFGNPQGGAHLSEIATLDRDQLRERQREHRERILRRELSRATQTIERRTLQQQQQPQRPVIWGTDRYKQLFAMAASMPDPEEVEEAEDVAAVVNDGEEEREEEDPNSIGAQYRDLLERTAELGRAGSDASDSSFDPMDEFTVTNDCEDDEDNDEDNDGSEADGGRPFGKEDSGDDGIEVIEREAMDFEAMD